MQTILRKVTIGLVLTAALVFAQSKPAFEVATIKPAAPLDQAKIMAALQSGGKMPVGMHLSPGQAEYLYVDMRTLISLAYTVKPNQVTGPDWMATTRFDITGKMPAGATKDDASKMLQSLLEERFKLTAHRSSAEHPVLAIVQGKGALKLKESAEKPVAIDESTPLRPGEMKMDGPDGPIRMSVNTTNGSAVIDMGVKGKMTQKINPANQSVHLDFSMTTLPGFAEMLSQMMSQMAGGATRPVVDMTDIKGNYDVSIEFPLAEILAMARNAGMDMGAAPGGRLPGAGPADTASDPSGGASSLTDAVQALGLKLESRKAMVEQIVVDKIEKTPTDN